MKTLKKTFNNLQNNKFKKISQNKNRNIAKNNIMEKTNKPKCNIHVMPHTITDSDINALFSGLIEVVKKKFELDNHQQICSLNYSHEKLKNELKNKISECNRLKNEIIYLKSILSNNNIKI